MLFLIYLSKQKLGLFSILYSMYYIICNRYIVPVSTVTCQREEGGEKLLAHLIFHPH